jgi:hypothetical protein
MITGIFALLMSVVAFYVCYKGTSTYYAVKKWNIVNAKVVRNEVKLNEHPRRAWLNYHLFVDYVYTFSGKEYKGSLLFHEELYSGTDKELNSHKYQFSKKGAEEYSNKIKNNMDVYVNPNNPTQAIMFTGYITLYYFGYVMSLFALLIGIYNIFKCF